VTGRPKLVTGADGLRIVRPAEVARNALDIPEQDGLATPGHDIAPAKTVLLPQEESDDARPLGGGPTQLATLSSAHRLGPVVPSSYASGREEHQREMPLELLETTVS
jgi:hypothetical protein